MGAASTSIPWLQDVFGQNIVMTLSACRLVHPTCRTPSTRHLALHTAMNTTSLISSSSRTAGFSGARNSRSLIRTRCTRTDDIRSKWATVRKHETKYGFLRIVLKEKVRVKRICNQSQIVLRNTWQSSYEE